MTWYVAPGSGAAAIDASEAYPVSVVVRFRELCEAVSTAGELVVVASPAGLSVVVRLREFCEAVSTVGELVVVASAVRVSVVVRLGEPCSAVSTSGELLVAGSPVRVSMVARLGELCAAVSTSGELRVAASPVPGVGDVATDRVFGCCVTLRITKTSATPVNSAIVPEESRFAREACVGSGGGTMVDRGGAPHEGQTAANELISFPHS